MQITLESLEQALAPLGQLGQGEATFDFGGTTISLRVLYPEEEAEMQKYASLAIKGEEDSNAREYIERFRLACLAYAIIQIGTLDLRGVDYVETGEKLANGVSVKIPKVEAVRKVLLKLTNPIRLGLFRKYTELLTQVENNAEAAIVFDPVEIDAEIERLEEKLASLRESQSAMKESLASDISKFTKAAAEMAPPAPVAAPAEEPTREALMEPEPTYTPVVTPAARQPITPTVVVAPVAPTQPPRKNPPIPPNAADYAAGLNVDDSFVDFSDTESMDAAIHAENMRLMQRRQGIAETSEVPSVLSSIRRAPHRAAQEAEEGLREYGQAPDGSPAYRLKPTEELSAPRQAAAPRPARSSVNPNFKSPKGV